MTYSHYREQLAEINAKLAGRFSAGDDIVQLVRGRATAIDEVLVNLWQALCADCGAALVAVGGYGCNSTRP